MNRVFRARLVFLLGAILAVAVLTLWGVENFRQRIGQLEERLTVGYLESFRLADEFQGRLLELNNTLLRYAAWREPAVWERFTQESDQLDHWIDQYDVRLNQQAARSVPANGVRAQEQAFIAQLNDAFNEYLNAARALHSSPPPERPALEGSAQFSELDRQSQHLQQLGTQLAEAHRRAQTAFLGEVNASLGVLRTSLFGAVVFLLVLVATLGVVLYRDLIAPLRTKLVQSEELLVRQEKLATLGTLAAGIAHEIRNPLTSIKARLYTLGKHIRGNDPGTADANIIASEITRLERIVQDVLLFARPSDPQPRAVSAVELLGEVQTLMASALEKTGVQLRLETGAEVRVLADPALIKQVLVNLVRNAAEAIEGTGTVTLRSRSDHQVLQGKEHAVAVLEVTDTGRGIPPEVEKRLFDPFFTTKEAGTGLGLSIAARIIEKHGGALQYQTQVGHGTTFGIVLPVAAAPG